MNSPAMQWLKSNIVIVIFGVIIIAAFIALPIVSSGMNKEVEAKLAKRKSMERDLTSLESTSIDLRDPSPYAERIEQQSALINPAALKAFREYTEVRVAEAEEVISMVSSHNRKDHTVLLPRLFPTPQAGQQQVLTDQMSKALAEAYRSLLRDLNAGPPPTLDSMKDTLVRQQNQFIQVELNKTRLDELTDEEADLLREELGGRRLSLAKEQAQAIGIYATINAFTIPSWTYGEGEMPSLAETFEWQWDYWAVHDICAAIAAANASAANVTEAPVKRLMAVIPVDEAGETVTRERRRDRNSGGGAAGGAGGPLLSGGSGGAGAGGRQPPQGPGGRGAAAGGAAGGQAPADPSQQLAADYSRSFTGRAESPLYDVRYYKVHCIVETGELPTLFDAIAKENLMTIVDIEMWPADPYDDLKSGYIYGTAPTTEVVMTIETVWLREWTARFMPDETKEALNIATGDQTATTN